MKLKQILNNRKGFTLMEIIVVLIIIAVLAAALIPSFVGFIRDSRSASAINQARVGMNAAQVLLTEAHGMAVPTLPFTAGVVSEGTLSTRFIGLLGSDVPAGTSVSSFTNIRVNAAVPGATFGSQVIALRYVQPAAAGGFTVDIVDGRATAYPSGTTVPAFPPAS